MVAREYRRRNMNVPWRLRLRRLLRWAFLLPVGLLIPVLLGFLMGQGGTAASVLGLAEAEAETVGPVGTGRILSIEVVPGQRVEPGAVLVRLDPDGPVLERAVQQARLLDFDQSLVRYRQTLEESERRCRQIVQEAAVELEAERMNQVRDVAQLQALREELSHLQALVQQHIVSEVELSSLRPQIAALDHVVERYEPLLGSLQRRYDQAVADLDDVRKRLAAADRDAPAATSRPPGQGVGGEPDVLRATRAGIVSRIQYQAGDVVVGGQAILRVTAEHSRHVVGMLDPEQAARLAVGDPVEIIRRTGQDPLRLDAVVESVDPEIMDLLDPYNPVPRFPVRGRRVRVRLANEAAALIPGETVTLRLPRGRTWFSALWPFSSP